MVHEVERRGRVTSPRPRMVGFARATTTTLERPPGRNREGRRRPSRAIRPVCALRGQLLGCPSRRSGTVGDSRCACPRPAGLERQTGRAHLRCRAVRLVDRGDSPGHQIASKADAALRQNLGRAMTRFSRMRSALGSESSGVARRLVGRPSAWARVARWGTHGGARWSTSVLAAPRLRRRAGPGILSYARRLPTFAARSKPFAKRSSVSGNGHSALVWSRFRSEARRRSGHAEARRSGPGQVSPCIGLESCSGQWAGDFAGTVP